MLYVVATPIGNLDDITRRAAGIFAEADALACEDTRRTRRLLSHLGIGRPDIMISYREGTETRAGSGLLKLLEQGKTVVLCSDGGYPGISDPGYRIIVSAAERNIPVEVIPGASAVPVALLLSGLPSSSYTFKGYPPRKKGAMLRFFESDKDLPHTMIVFESPLRVVKSLESAQESLGNRRAAVCIEMTKKFERVSRGFLDELINEFRDRRIRGEVTIVLAGNNPKFAKSS